MDRLTRQDWDTINSALAMYQSDVESAPENFENEAAWQRELELIDQARNKVWQRTPD